jgi:hypothetical protein
MDNFYLLVAGSRGYDNYGEMCRILDFLLSKQIKKNRHIVIVSGGAKGADTLAERYADSHGYEKHIIPADWNRYGRSAGYRRNEEMHKYISSPSANNRGCICFWDTKSPGTKHNFELAKQYNNPLRVYDTVNHCFIERREAARLTACE